MTLTPQFLDNLKDRVSLVEQVGRVVKLVRKGNEYWGACPFHNEKTASFSVVENKGFYHCFGCGAHGTVIDFEMKINNLTFPEAVDKLALIAGVEVPKASFQDIEKEKKRVSIYEVLEETCLFYQKQLMLDGGREGFLYLKRRGLSDVIISKFRLGYAAGNNTLKAHLKGVGFPDDLIQSAGVLTYPTDGRSSYDYFRDRVIFPILDKKNRVIAFGGRILDQGEPKYLNSPETEVFSKGDVLFGLSFATAPARASQEIILVEGYMDTIALHAVGIENVVAPLGTALTERQIAQLWKLAPEPVLCFDGDVAGQRASIRAAERVLPMLKAGYSLQFMTLPDNLDPDEYVSVRGQTAFQELIKNQAKPLFKLLWQSLLKGKNLDTPERKASLEKEIFEMLGKIADASVQNFYRQEFKSALWEATRLTSSTKKVFKKTKFKNKNEPELLSVYHPMIVPKKDETRMMIAYLVMFPEVGGDFLEDFADWHVNDTDLAEILGYILSALAENPDISSTEILAYLDLNVEFKMTHFLATEIEILTHKEMDIHSKKSEIKERLRLIRLSAIETQMNDLRNAMKTADEVELKKLWDLHEKLRQERNTFG